MKKSIIFSIIFLLLLAPLVLADHPNNDHEEEHGTASDNLQIQVASISLKATGIATAILLLLIIIAVFSQKHVMQHKKGYFIAIILISVITTVYLVGATLYLNAYSETRGPVHWHADFEFWNCGEEIDLIDPTGLTNKVGTPVLHEHGDNRIHVEGVLVRKTHADLKSFLEVVGGEITQESLRISTNTGELILQNGDECNGQPGELQAFLLRLTNPDPTKDTGFTYTQQKLEDFPDYVMAPFQNVPPGDCIIIEFDEEKETTDKLCETYRIEIEQGDLTLIE